MQVKAGKIPGCYLIDPEPHRDNRGELVKVYQDELFKKYLLQTEFQEDFYSTSRQGVLRGLHFQAPPADYTKIVCCVLGEVFDAIVDLRVGSPTFGQFETFRLNSTASRLLYLPPGIAHGFYVLSELAILWYKTTARYSPAHDGGIHWASAGIPWPNQTPLISERDATLPVLKELASPFKYEKK